MTETLQHETLFGFSNFGHWKLFDICDLIFVISIIQWTPKKQIATGNNQSIVLWVRIITIINRLIEWMQYII